MQQLTLRKLAEYCRDYVDLVSPSAFARSDKKIQLQADIFSAEPLLNNVAEINYDEQIVLPISFTINVSDLSLESEEAEDEVHKKVNRDLEIARDLDDVQRKFETNSYTKQLSLQFGKISFRGFPSFNDEDIEIEENGRKNAF